MAVIQAHGIAANLPSGFEGRIFVRAVPTGIAYSVAQFATFLCPTTSATSAAAPST